MGWMRRGAMLGTLLTLIMIGATGTARATISISVGTCNATYCDFTVTANEWVEVLVGKYSVSGTSYNAVCAKDSSGNCDACAHAQSGGNPVDTSDVRVFGSDNIDLMRLADRTGESCTGHSIIGSLDDAADQFMFWGGGGNDEIHLCDTTGSSEPSTSDCLALASGMNAGRADGRAGVDYIYGSPYDENLWGGSEVDHIYAFSGEDYVHGGPDTDYLYGGDDWDYLDGAEGSIDYCNCGEDANPSGDYCECSWAYHCNHYCSESPEREFSGVPGESACDDGSPDAGGACDGS
ncbi:MAG: hypothetical protein HY907_15180 [Deltaproteobacteria bacterium]|nr:hypothetical protein [Deltaproteobacteria bacterium]